MSYSFLFASWGSSGNLSPLLTTARLLRKNGHRIRVIADPAMRQEIETADFPFLTWRRAPTGTAADPTDASDLKDFVRRAVFNPAAAYAADVLDEINRAPTDAVVCIDALIGAAVGAEAGGLPLAMLAPHVSIRPLPGVPHAASGMVAPKTPEERSNVAAASERFIALFNEFLPVLNEVRAHLGLSLLGDFIEVFDRADRILLGVSPAFDYPADYLPANIRYVGPLLDEPGWSKPWRAPWPAESRRPRVLITCSTGAQGQGALMQRIINAVGMMDVDAVATAGPNLNIAEFSAPKNVHLLQSAPHDAVMKEVALVISQGGHGTVNRALINGLPQLILPNGRDQGDNAARVEAKGVGIGLPVSASEAEIVNAAKQLLAEPAFKTAACRLGAAIRADVAASSVVRELETMVANRREFASDPRRNMLKASA